MSRRKTPSKRRYKLWFNAGLPIAHVDIFEHPKLIRYVMKHGIYLVNSDAWVLDPFYQLTGYERD